MSLDKFFVYRIRNKIKIGKYFLTVLFFITSINISAQWVSNPSLNTQLVIDTQNPIDINSVSDGNGGAFIVWQDSKDSVSNVYFMHVDAEGKISFRADGKTISDASGAKTSPMITPYSKNSAVIVWKDYTSSNNGNLFAQRVMSNGNLAWSAKGIRLTKTQDNFSSPSANSNKQGSVFVTYVSKEPAINGDFKVIVRKISSTGKLTFGVDSLVVFKSKFRKSNTAVIADEKGGAFLFWLDFQNAKTMILGQHIDSAGTLTWGKKPVVISNPKENVLNYTAVKTSSGTVYLAWQIQKPDKDIYHQMIGLNGKVFWQEGGKKATQRKGDQINPQAVAIDSTVILSWTNNTLNDKNIFIQKFNKKGMPMWKENGVPVIKVKGEQFGQKIIADGEGGIISSWIDRRQDTTLANIYIQRISNEGKLLWDSTGVAAASNFNTLKSYLSIVPDQKGGALVFFKNSRNNKNDIYGQKIFNTGTYISQILGFTAQLVKDSINISWYSANEIKNTSYSIQRAAQNDTGHTKWTVIKTYNSEGSGSAKHYSYIDRPAINGTVYYRIIQKSGNGNVQQSNIERVNYFSSSDEIIVAQNNPNPFTKSTVISFYLPHKAKVKIEFFDSHVKKINEIDQEFPEGENSIKFSADGLPTGIYFYRFRSGSFVDVKKMVISN